MKRYFLQMAVCAAVVAVSSVTAADTVETSLPGGVTHGYGELVQYNPEGFGTCTFRSEPEGVLCATRTEIMPEGEMVQTEVGDPENSPFAYWTVDWVAQRDENGIARRQLSFAMPKGDVEVTMVAVSDKARRTKVFWYGNEQLADTSDTDGDGQTFAQEMTLGTSPRFPDVSSGKGVVHGYGELIVYNPEGCGVLTRRSEPEGVLMATTQEFVAPGTLVEKEIGNPESSTFAYWAVDGVAARDSNGIALRSVSFEMPARDVDLAEVVFDDPVVRAKMFWYGTETVADSSDTDHDGLTFAEELKIGTSPRFSDESKGRGVVHGYGELIEVDFRSIGDYLNCPHYTFETDSGHGWTGDASVSHDGEGSMRSGKIGDGESSELAVFVKDEGTIRFWWKTSSEAFKDYQIDYVSFRVDGVEKAWRGGETDWAEVSVPVVGPGRHELSWVYVKDGQSSEGLDCAWVDELSWSGVGYVVVPAEVIGGKALLVEDNWHLQYGDAFTQLFGEDLRSALMKPSGKIGTGGTPMLVWQDYVAGTDPTDETDVFTASITIVDGKVTISYLPELDDTRKAMRKYTTWGKTSLMDTDWTEVQKGRETEYNFFKVSVEMR